MDSALVTLKAQPEQPEKAERAPNKGKQHLSGNDVADVLRWHAQGLTGEQIALKFTPPKHPTTITRAIARYGFDNAAEAKRILRGGAADMALNVVRRGQPKDHVNALKGLGVLEEQQQTGLTVVIGAGSQVSIGILVGGESSKALEE